VQCSSCFLLHFAVAPDRYRTCRVVLLQGQALDARLQPPGCDHPTHSSAFCHLPAMMLFSDTIQGATAGGSRHGLQVAPNSANTSCVGQKPSRDTRTPFEITRCRNGTPGIQEGKSKIVPALVPDVQLHREGIRSYLIFANPLLFKVARPLLSL
jgi:hypothetical protein